MPASLPLVAYVIALIAIEVHEADAAAEDEWAVLHLPGGRTASLVTRAIEVALLAAGLVMVARGERIGDLVGFFVGAAGLLGSLVHAWLWRRGSEAFRAPESVASIACMGAGGLFAFGVFLVRILGGT